MKYNQKFARLTVIAASSAVALAAMPILANHSWSNYHWATTNGIVGIPVVDNTSGEWPARIGIAVADWNKSSHINSQLESGAANPRRCSMVQNTIQVCNAGYGYTGWLGIASISLSGGHIIAGSTKLNDTYFSSPSYADEVWKQLVACQEIGHDYGLTHQNEDFSTDLTNSCMEYTSLPAGNDHPDQHDYDQLNVIYGSHTDSGSGGGSGGGKPGKGKPLGIDPGNNPNEWGTAIGFNARGKANVFTRNVNGYTVVTHVTWAPDSMQADHVRQF